MQSAETLNLTEFVHGIYGEMRHIAGLLLQTERSNHTLQATALANEALLRLFENKSVFNLPPDRFLRVAAGQMRRTLIDHARRHRSQKRGGDYDRASLLDIAHIPGNGARFWNGLNDALDRLGRLDPRALSVVELKFFAGHTTDEIAGILGISDATVETDWQFARAWLYGALKE